MKRRFSAAFLLGIILGLGGETLLLSKTAAARFSDNLRKDFRVLFFMPEKSLPQTLLSAQKSVDEIPGTQSSILISPEKALSILKKEDPELAQNLSFLPTNPIEPIIEATLNKKGLLSFQSWMSQAAARQKWTEMRYQPEELKSILRLGLYLRFLNVALTALLCLSSLLLILGVLFPLMVFSKRSPHKMIELLSLSAKTFGICLLGVCLGGIFSAAFAWPLGRAVEWWGWPTLLTQAIFIVPTALSGAILCVW